MTIAIDCRMIDASGVGVYLRGCLPYFLQSPHRFFLFGNQKRIEDFIAETAPGNTHFETADCTIKPFSPVELFAFPSALLKKINAADKYYSPFFNIPAGLRIPAYLTIHDIVFPDMPDLTTPLGLLARLWFYRRGAKKAKKLFTVSRFSKSRIEHFLGAKKPVIVTHSALQPYLLEDSEGLESAGAEKKNYIVFLGNIKKHKGLSCLLKALRLARSEGLPHGLVVLGQAEHFRTGDREVTRLMGATKGVTFTGEISNQALKALVAQAALLVQPSLYEGFGLPPLEAMVLGTQALISDIPVFREIYAGFPVVFFRAGDSGDLKDKLMELLYNKEPPRIRLGAEQRNRYSFQKTAGIILSELEGAG